MTPVLEETDEIRESIIFGETFPNVPMNWELEVDGSKRILKLNYSNISNKTFFCTPLSGTYGGDSQPKISPEKYKDNFEFRVSDGHLPETLICFKRNNTEDIESIILTFYSDKTNINPTQTLVIPYSEVRYYLDTHKGTSYAYNHTVNVKIREGFDIIFAAPDIYDIHNLAYGYILEFKSSECKNILLTASRKEHQLGKIILLIAAIISIISIFFNRNLIKNLIKRIKLD